MSFNVISKNVRTVDYFDISIDVTCHARFVATDKDGEIWSYSEEPYIDEQRSWWRVDEGGGMLGHIEYEGDWKDSLLEIKHE